MRVQTACIVVALFQACVPTEANETIRGAVGVHIAEPEPASRAFATSDGWSVHVERIFGTVGVSAIDPPVVDITPRRFPCADSRAGRETFGLVDFAHPFDLEERGHYPQTCSVRGTFVLSPVADLLTRGVGISQEDAEGFRGSNRGKLPLPGRITSLRYARVIGSAHRDQRSVHFDWWISRSITSTILASDTERAIVAIPSGAKVDVPFGLDAAQLFRVSLNPNAAIRFEAIAALDENEDGVVDTDELDALWPELPGQIAYYTLPSLDLSIQDFVGLQLDAAWRLGRQ